MMKNMMFHGPLARITCLEKRLDVNKENTKHPMVKDAQLVR
jgi:hypothetical protein